MQRLLIPFFLALLIPGVASAQLGGPNAAGYTYDAVTLDYVAPTGTALAVGNDTQMTVTLPWDFEYYGVDYTTINVSDNGALSFVSTTMSATNGCLPAATNAPAIAPFWEALDPSLALPLFPPFPGVYAWHDVANDRFIIDWQQIPVPALFPFGFAGSFQAHLYPDGAIEFHYDSLDWNDPVYDDGAGATIGIQDVEGSADRDELEVSCNSVTTLDGTALRFEIQIDDDGDGYSPTTDCDDNDASINPGATEVCDDGIDQDCTAGDLNGDVDSDGYDNEACGGDDCNDGNANVNPGIDADSDGFNVCEDCVDTIASINPDALEVCDDGLDNDCDGNDTVGDQDGDGIDSEDCGGIDCDDGDPLVHPGIDADGDGDDSCVDCDDSDAAINAGTDADSDGFTACEDCNDNDDTINPDATEICDATDWNCDGIAAVDADGDGDAGDACGGADCDDNDPTIFTGAPEVCDGLDTDCDGLNDGQDGNIGGDSTFSSTFEVNDGGLIATGSWDYGDPTSGPGAAFSGSNVWATNIAGDYPNNDNASLTFETTVPVGAATLSFQHYTDDEAGYDYTYVNIIDSTGTSQVDQLPSVFAWTLREIDLSAWAGEPVTIEFLHTSDSSIPQEGTYLDDILLGSIDDADGDGWIDNCPGYGDCDSTDVTIYPGAPETCNDGIDQSCNGEDATGDLDGDGFVDANCGGDDCDDDDPTLNPGEDYDEDGTNYCDDCDDDDPDNYPGNLETCADGIDQNCDGVDDTGDEDGDGYVTDACIGGDDCDDGNEFIHPGIDADGDGSSVCEDCNDNTALQFPGNIEVCGDNFDNDCDGFADDIDEDGDGHTSSDCNGGDDCDDTDPTLSPSIDEDEDGFSTCDEDCDDNDDTINPDAADTCDDGIDQDCNGMDLETDFDADGFANALCGGDDCDDLSADFNPSIEEWCDGLDHNCDGDTFTTDEDGDFSFDEACGGDDCNDADPTVHPTAPEICDAQDNDCDGEFLEGGEADEDGDGYETCADDCDDQDENTYPTAREICDDLDNDCDDPELPEAERIDEGIVRDRDSDGHEAPSCGGGDCNDDLADVYPQESEALCADSLDNDCDGAPDGEDSDCDNTLNEGCGCESSVVGRGQGAFGLLLLGLIGLRRRRA
jgi:large repetitive protein